MMMGAGNKECIVIKPISIETWWNFRYFFQITATIRGYTQNIAHQMLLYIIFCVLFDFTIQWYLKNILYIRKKYLSCCFSYFFPTCFTNKINIKSDNRLLIGFGVLCTPNSVILYNLKKKISIHFYIINLIYNFERLWIFFASLYFFLLIAKKLI